jgi:hypothetical protein
VSPYGILKAFRLGYFWMNLPSYSVADGLNTDPLVWMQGPGSSKSNSLKSASLRG